MADEEQGSTSYGVGKSVQDAGLSWDDSETLDFTTVGEEGRFSVSESNRAWGKMYSTFNLTSDDQKKNFRKVMYLWFAKNSTSGRADLDSSLVINGKRVTARQVFRQDTVPPTRMRRFLRAETNIAEFEALLRLPQAEVAMRSLALRSGVRPDLYIVVPDVAEYFNLSPVERQELNRVKGAKVLYSAPLVTPVVAREVNAGSVETVQSDSSAPAPSTFVNSR